MKDTNAKVCDVHGRPMGSWSVRVVYGVRRGLKQSPDYLRARRAQFPNCDDWVNSGCVLREARSRQSWFAPAVSKPAMHSCESSMPPG